MLYRVIINFLQNPYYIIVEMCIGFVVLSQVPLSHLRLLPTIHTREVCIVGNGQILQWDAMSKINILRS